MANVSLVASIADQTASQAAGFSAQLVPTGVILSYGGANAPTGWLLCDGRAISRTTFAGLYAVLTSNGTTFPFGSGDGSTTFNLPDLRGRFPRYDDNMGNHGISGVTASGAASRDTGRLHGSTQTQTTAKNGLAVTNNAVTSTAMSANASHSHAQVVTAAITGGSGVRTDYQGDFSGAATFSQGVSTSSTNTDHTHSTTSNVTLGAGDAETRPINVAVNAIIKI